jgi:endonuclease YncB( thermonuclease family)
MTLKTLLFALIGFVSLNAETSSAQTVRVAEIYGTASIVDGDTIAINGIRIRLLGIDAPEARQICLDEKAKSYRCGIAARDALERLIAGQTVTCRPEGLDRFRRTLATCATLRFADLGLEMIRQGWATVYDGAQARLGYLPMEQAAERRRIGLWRGGFERPSAWRRHRAAE